LSFGEKEGRMWDKKIRRKLQVGRHFQVDPPQIKMRNERLGEERKRG
jgi:hypothetical protein